jgi:two-component system LytT family sensor kinase
MSSALLERPPLDGGGTPAGSPPTGREGEPPAPGAAWLLHEFTARTWGMIAAGWLVVAAVRAAFDLVARYSVDDPPAPAEPYLFGTYTLDAAMWVLLMPVVSRLTRRFPLERGLVLRNGGLLMLVGIVLVTVKMAVFLSVAGPLGLIRSGPPFLYAVFAFGGQDLTVYWAAALATYAMHRSRALREREVARAQVETQLAQAQLQALKVQIQPHFLFNTLHAIATLVREDPARAERTVEHLSEMLRTTLTHHQAQEVALRDELETLHPYLEIEKVRLGERLAVQLEVGPGVQGALVPHLLLQPLVENAVRHGISPRRRPGWVRVEARAGDGWLHLAVEDNGRGMSGPVRPGAIGLANTRARLRQLYGEHHRFEIRSVAEAGTRIEIELPLRTETR